MDNDFSSKTALDNFDLNIKSVRELMHFDRFLLDWVIAHVEKASDDIKKVQGITNPRYTLEALLSGLKRVKGNDSLRPKYETIFNSCLVLTVAYFSSALDELFKEGLKAVMESGKDVPFGKEKIEFTISELQQRNFHVKYGIEDLIASKEDNSWQDMQSVHRTFKKFFGFDISSDTPFLNTIITSQACRHVIVHSNGIASARTMNQIKNASNRRIKPDLAKGAVIQFQPEEIEIVISAMREYLSQVSADLESTIGI